MKRSWAYIITGFFKLLNIADTHQSVQFSGWWNLKITPPLLTDRICLLPLSSSGDKAIISWTNHAKKTRCTNLLVHGQQIILHYSGFLLIVAPLTREQWRLCYRRRHIYLLLSNRTCHGVYWVARKHWTTRALFIAIYNPLKRELPVSFPFLK